MEKNCALCSSAEASSKICQQHTEDLFRIFQMGHKLAVSCPKCGIIPKPMEAYLSQCFPHIDKSLYAGEDLFLLIQYTENGCDACATDLTKAIPKFTKLRGIQRK